MGMIEVEQIAQTKRSIRAVRCSANRETRTAYFSLSCGVGSFLNQKTTFLNETVHCFIFYINSQHYERHCKE